MNLRSRVGLTGGAAVLGALLAGSLIIYPSLSTNLHERVDSQLIEEAAQAPQLVGTLKEKLVRTGAPANLTKPIDVNGTQMQIVPGPIIAGQSSGLAPLTRRDVEVANGDGRPYLTTVKYQGVAYRLYTAAMKPFSGIGFVTPAKQTAAEKRKLAQALKSSSSAKVKEGGARQADLVRIAMPLAASASTLGRLEFLLIVLTIGGSVVAALIARLAAGRVLRPVRRLTDTVEHVTQTRDLTARIQVGGRDEVGRLGRSFTAMMVALDDSVNAQRHLVADASHELRTPLTSLTTNLELLAEEHGLDDPEAPAMVREALGQAAELRHLVNDLVDLAHFGEAEPHVEDVRLDLLTEQVVHRAAGRTPGVRFETELSESLVSGDPAALARAIGNLVDNAVKWSPAEGRVLVTAGAGEVTVADEGPGVAEADRPFVFDRFYRSAAARALPGSGLGLAIVAKVAQTHGGRVAVEPATIGARFRLSFPECR